MGDSRPADSYFDELSFVDEDFEVVPASFCEDLGAHGGFEAIAVCRFGPKALWVEFDFVAGFLGVPAEECYLEQGVRASKPSGVFIMISSLSCFSSILELYIDFL